MSNLGKYQDLTTRMKESGGVDEFFEEHDEQIREECRKEHEEQLREEHAKGFKQGGLTTAAILTACKIANTVHEYHEQKIEEEWQAYITERNREEKLKEATYYSELMQEQIKKDQERLEEAFKKLQALKKAQDDEGN